MARTMLRGIRVASKQELIARIHLYYDEINADPVIFRWTHKMDETIWPTAAHFVSWLGLCPDNDISGGRVL